MTEDHASPSCAVSAMYPGELPPATCMTSSTAMTSQLSSMTDAAAGMSFSWLLNLWPRRRMFHEHIRAPVSERGSTRAEARVAADSSELSSAPGAAQATANNEAAAK